jgi:hypothetical protein
LSGSYKKRSLKDACEKQQEEDATCKPCGKNGVLHVPDGRACPLCSRKDDADDPVAKARGVKKLMYWGKPPKDGKTCGCYCGYCTKHFISKIKPTLQITLKQYEAHLGQSKKRFEEHALVIDALVKHFIDNCLSISTHVPWDVLEEKVLAMLNAAEVKIKKPGYSHVEWDFYHKDRNLEDNLAAGHREYVQGGVRGVLVPDAPITRIEFNDIHRAEIRGEKVRCFSVRFYLFELFVLTRIYI